jgi:hypothetical protein
MMATVLAGVAVLVAPFALHLNVGSHWTKGTETMFWSGVGIVVVGLLALMVWQRDLNGAVAEASPQPAVEEGLEQGVEAPASGSQQKAPSAEEQWEADLAKLAEAVLQDLKAETEPPKRPEPVAVKPQDPEGDDLQAVASALLRDLSERMQVGVDSGRGGRSS